MRTFPITREMRKKALDKILAEHRGVLVMNEDQLAYLVENVRRRNGGVPPIVRRHEINGDGPPRHEGR